MASLIEDIRSALLDSFSPADEREMTRTIARLTCPITSTLYEIKIDPADAPGSDEYYIRANGEFLRRRGRALPLEEAKSVIVDMIVPLYDAPRLCAPQTETVDAE